MDGFSTAGEMIEALRARRVSSLELLEFHRRRIERYHPILNAVVYTDFDAARRTAEAADAERRRGEDRPLLGLPITVKDCIYLKGMPTTGGVPERKHAVSGTDARTVARLREAGAVFMGKTNVPPYAADWQSDNPVYGRTNNPWDPARTPGGSSGGAAAALAAGLTPLELGGDLGGSIRIPSAFCGVYGHKSSETALPNSGHFPRPNTPNSAVSMPVQGPMARSAGDLERALDLLAGADAGEDRAWRIAFPPARAERPSGFRIAFLPLPSWLPVDSEIVEAMESLASFLIGQGAKVGTAQPSLFSNLRDHLRLYFSLMAALTSAGKAEADRRAEAAITRGRWEAYGDGWEEFGRAWADGLVASASDYLLWHGRREAYRADYRAFFEEWDVLIAPVDVTNAFPHLPASAERTLDVEGTRIPYDLQLLFPGLCNLSGQPGTAFPAGRTRGGLPIGLQAIGPYLEDRTPIRLASLLERDYYGFHQPPGFEE